MNIDNDAFIIAIAIMSLLTLILTSLTYIQNLKEPLQNIETRQPIIQVQQETPPRLITQAINQTREPATPPLQALS